MFGKLAITKKEKCVVLLVKQHCLTALGALYLMCGVLLCASELSSAKISSSSLRQQVISDESFHHGA